MSFGEARDTKASAVAALVVPEQHRLRSKTERFIREIYHEEYGATLGGFPTRLITILDERGEILCAAGLRSRDDGFFSERYLNSPIEAALGRLRGEVVRRDQVFEISTFASRSPHSVPRFVGQVIEYGDDAGFEWGFFTLTHRLSLLLNRIGLELAPLGAATSTHGTTPRPGAAITRRIRKCTAGSGTVSRRASPPGVGSSRMREIYNSLRRRAATDDAKLVFSDEANSLTREELLSRAGALGLELPPGVNRVGILAANGVDWAAAQIMGVACGKTVVPLPPFFQPRRDPPTSFATPMCS